jgi:alanine racemase
MRTIQVDLACIRHNYQLIRKTVAPSKVMAVVKANAYGHGMLEVAKTLESIGVDVLGVADMHEALSLRRSGIKSRILAWLVQPQDLDIAGDFDIEVGISTFEQLEKTTTENKLHIKVDTGLGRNGFAQSDWQELVERLKGRENLLGVFSHLSNTSEVEDSEQQKFFEEFLHLAKSQEVSFSERHLAASAASIRYPHMRYDLVRSGIAVYGLNPFEDREVGLDLRPAMRVSAEMVNCKKVPAGQGVSYGYRYKTERATTLGLVPFGYSEGMPRISSGHRVLIAGKLYPVVGRVAMDQFVVDLEGDEFPTGQEVVIFGSATTGEPSAEQLGASAQTINYEIVTRIGGRANRVYVNR